MFKRNIDKVLKLLTIFPPLLVIILSLFMTFYIVLENQKEFERESFELKKKFLKNSRLTIYNEVNKIYEYIEYEHKDSEDRLKENLKNRVNDAYSIISGILKRNEKLSKQQKVKLIKDALRDIRFNDGRGYFYIYSMQGECILLPIQSKLEGSNFLEVKDKRGKYITRSIIKSLQNGNEEFMNWWWYKPQDINKQYKKISFNKYIPQLDMYVGTGDYIEDFEFVIKTKVIDYISSLKYDEGQYFFILNYEGNVIYHPNTSIMNKHISVLNSNDRYNLEEIINIAKLGEGYISYASDFFGKYDEDMIKTSYIKGLDKWQWAIGRGFYKKELTEQINKNHLLLEEQNKDIVFKIVVLSVVVTLILVMILFYNIKFLQDRFNKINKKIEDEIKANNEKDKLLFHQSKMASLGEMLQNIAHQWRQPLSVVSTSASGLKLKKDYGLLDDKSIDESVDTIMKSCSYLSKTIDDFRNFYKSDKEVQVFNIKEVLDDSLDILKVKLQNNHIDVHYKCINLEYKALKNELIQVIMNIIGNAIDAFDKESKKHIFIDVKKDDKFLYISFKDSAGGINENIIDRIFEPYFTTKHKAQGTGIGLFMSEEIISKHFAGKIVVKNENYEYDGYEYKGANFIIELPLKN